MPEKRPDPDQRWTIGKWGRHDLVIGPDTGPAESSKEVVEVISLSAVSELRDAARAFRSSVEGARGDLAFGDYARTEDRLHEASEKMLAVLIRFPVPDEKETPAE